MAHGNGGPARIIPIVLSIVLGATTVAGVTTSIIGWGDARKAEKLDQEIKDLKGQILTELKNLSDGQGTGRMAGI